MDCLACGTADSRVVKSLDDGVSVRRFRICKCGARWSTDEVSNKRSLKATNGQHAPPIAISQLPMATNGQGGVGGGVSSDPVLFPDSDPNPDVVVNPIRARERAKRRVVDYPYVFEIIWEQTGKRGTKYPAYKAWLAAGQPSWVAVQAPWRAYLLSERPQAGFIKDLSSWINGRGHEQEWMPVSSMRTETPQDRIRREQRDRDRQDTQKQLEATERQLAKFRPYQNGHPQPGQVQSVIAELAEQKAVTK